MAREGVGDVVVVEVWREGLLYLTNTLSGVGEVYQTAFYGLAGDVAVVGVWRESVGNADPACAIQSTATPIATQLPPVPTNTPRPTRTPTLETSPTRLPTARPIMDNGRLTNCEFEPRVPGGLPSRDVNPPGSPASALAYAPLDSAEVMIIDTAYEDATQNQGLGKFVAIRIDSTLLTTACNRQNGWSYIGYAHLSSVLVPDAVLNPPFPLVPSTLQVGMTGATGTDNVHLDVTVFWLPKSNAFGADPAPRAFGSILNGIPVQTTFESFTGLATNPIFEAVIVDPLEIWSDLVIGTTCSATIICP
jgi:hypothetical protein